MKIDRIWAMPNKWTFTIPPIRCLLIEELNGVGCDPFAGENSPAQITNDLRQECPATSHTDALTFLQQQPSDHFDYVLFDPPYSITQAAECYKSAGIDKLAV